MTLPTLFLSHGSPMLAIQDSPARRALIDLGATLSRPTAILVVSAHWQSADGPTVSLSAQPKTIHDFGGFPRALFDIQYPAPGAAETADRAAALFERAGISVKRDPLRGLDHGAWVPLSLMYPKADIPVAQISLCHGGSPAEHLHMGKALQTLRDEGILLIGSGALTHNLSALNEAALDAPPLDWVSKFADWISDRLDAGQYPAVLDYRTRAPFAARNHPTDEHLLPLFVALGAAGAAPRTTHLHASYQYGALAMDAYAFS